MKSYGKPKIGMNIPSFLMVDKVKFQGTAA